MHNPYPEFLIRLGQLFLEDPQNGDDMVIVSPLADNDDGSFSFKVMNPKKERSYKITGKIEEI